MDDVPAYGCRGGGAVIRKLVYPVRPAQIAQSARPRQQPSTLLVGVTATHVYGFDSKTRHSPAGPMVFQVSRNNLETKVHQRANVRVLELIETTTGSRIELEGSRIPLTHSRDVIAALEG